MDRRPGTRHGLVRPSFIPPRPQRELRDLTRYRTTFVRERATLVNRVQKVLESTNLKLASVVSDVMGVSSRAILAALLAGEADPAVLAGLAKGQLRKKRPQLEQALQGHLYPHQSFVLTELLAQIESLEETVARFDAQIREACDRQDDPAQVVALLDTIPGIAQGTAHLLVAEIGSDMPRLTAAAALADRAGRAPGDNRSARHHRRGRTRQGDVRLGPLRAPECDQADFKVSHAGSIQWTTGRRQSPTRINKRVSMTSPRWWRASRSPRRE